MPYHLMLNVLSNRTLPFFLLHVYKEGNVLFNDTLNILFTVIWKEGRKCFIFNDALNTLYLRLYSIGHMVKDHSDSDRGNLLPSHRLIFPINSKGSFICTIPHGLSRIKLSCRGALAGTRNRYMCRSTNTHTEIKRVTTLKLLL